jgi:membrane protein YqaA with SNARE-associated domain
MANAHAAVFRSITSLTPGLFRNLRHGVQIAWIAGVRAWFFSVLAYFLTPFGIVLMGALDASMVFFLPLGIDFVVILMTARKPELFWLYALLATAGSTIGAAGTFWIGKAVGEKGLTRFVNQRRLDRVKARVERGTFVVAALGLIPPPFPFTPFVLASGALGMNPWSFLPALAAVRVFRFGVEAGLASHYGSQILRWMKTPMFQTVVGVFIGLALLGTVISAIALVRGTRRQHGAVRKAAA